MFRKVVNARSELRQIYSSKDNDALSFYERRHRVPAKVYERGIL